MKRKMQRRLSFGSLNLAEGAFPAESGVSTCLINILMYTKFCLPSYDTFIQHVNNTLLQYTRFRSVVRKTHWCPPRSAYWEEVDVDVTKHVKKKCFENEEEINKFLYSLMKNNVFDDYVYENDKPHWEILLIENKTLTKNINEKKRTNSHDDCNNNIVIFRIDHAMGDGIALVEVFGSILSDMEGNKLQNKSLIFGLRRKAKQNEAKYPMRFLRSSHFPQQLIKIIDYMLMGMYRVYNFIRGLPDILLPVLGKADVNFFADKNEDIRKSNYAFVHQPHDPFFVKTPPLSLRYVEEIKSSAHVSVNDVLMAAFAGAIRKYSENARNGLFSEETKGNISCKVLLPFAFERPAESYKDEAIALRNKWVMVSAKLPVEQDTACQRLVRMNQIMRSIKERDQHITNSVFQQCLGSVLPRLAIRKTANDLFRKHTAVFANVPACKEICALAGAEIHEIQVLYVNVIPQVEIISYGGSLYFNIVGDREDIPQPHLIPQFFIQELKELGKSFGLDEQSLTAQK